MCSLHTNWASTPATRQPSFVRDKVCMRLYSARTALACTLLLRANGSLALVAKNT